MIISKVAEELLLKRYVARDAQGEALETPEQIFERVAKCISDVEEPENRNKYYSEFLQIMANNQFMPNSPTLMNANRPLGQLSACFVLPVEDSMEGIFKAVGEAAVIHKSGGGTGFSFTKLRGKSSFVASTGGTASGPLSFMQVFNVATDTVKQGGKRRGANMGVLRVDHPDIMDFIQCKADSVSFTNFNLSIAITDAFMQALSGNTPDTSLHSNPDGGYLYYLVDPHTGLRVGVVDSREVFNAIVHNAWALGDPGLIFIDRVNNQQPNVGIPIEATNPCGEQPLLPYESCNLGSINLAALVKDGKVNYRALTKVVKTAVRFLDNVITANKYPLPAIQEMTCKYRKIGLGVMGFADMLIACGIVYGSPESITMAEEVMFHIKRTAQATSEQLAVERGAFPEYENLKEECAKFGMNAPIRNLMRITIAPTGTISLIAGVSSGIEPIFSYAYTRKIVGMEDSRIVAQPLLNILKKYSKNDADKIIEHICATGDAMHCYILTANDRALLVSARDLTPEEHIRMQAAFQRNTENAISKTINFDSTATEEDVRNAYMLAWELNCKGITIYRDGSRSGQVLNVGTTAKQDFKYAASYGKAYTEPYEDAMIKAGLITLESRKRALSNLQYYIPFSYEYPNDTDDCFCKYFQQPYVSKAIALLDSDGGIADISRMSNYMSMIGCAGAVSTGDAEDEFDISHGIEPRERGRTLYGSTTCIKTGCGKLYVTINYDDQGICEVFTSTGKGGGCPSQSEASSRLISIALRAGISMEEIISQLKGIRCPSALRSSKSECMSCPDAIAKQLASVYNSLGVITPVKPNAPACISTPLTPHCTMEPDYADKCPECGAKLTHQGGCMMCLNCGWSKCN